MDLNDELLCAYLDNELDADQQQRVTEALAQDAGGRLRLERMRAADARLRAEIPVQSLPAGDPLAQRILQGSPAVTASARASTRPRWWAGGLAMAAGIGGVVLGMVLARSSGDTSVTAGRIANPELVEALEQVASGGRLADQGSSVAVVLTVRTPEGEVCRLFRQRAGDLFGEGLACRRDQGWRVLAWDATVGETRDFHPAGTAPLLDSVLDRLGGTTLSPDEERVLLARGWSVSAE